MNGKKPGTNGRRPRLSLFGNFGRGNLGNECTLHAMLCNVRRYLPDAQIRCICKGPEETVSTYGIAAVPMRDTSFATPPRPGPRLMKLLRRIVIGLPSEVYRCMKAVRTLRQTDVLVMTGTGMLGDFGIVPFDLHYDILRWSILAKLCRCRLLFVSVGAGPINHPLSRRFVKWALALGDYRSYRDSFSREYLESIGFKRHGDAVYPDLAFSLPRALIPGQSTRDGFRPALRQAQGALSLSRGVVGVGLMAYYGGDHTVEPSEAVHQDYVAKLATFVTWLLEHQYTVRLVIGDERYDRDVRRELINVLEERHVQYQQGQLIDDPITSAGDVFSQLATADIVVASRFHNVLMALMLGKPVLAISYHEKFDELMEGFGLGAYCQHIDRLDISGLIGQFTALEKNAQDITARIMQKAEASRRLLDDQYDRIFSRVAPQAGRVHAGALAGAADALRREAR